MKIKVDDLKKVLTKLSSLGTMETVELDVQGGMHRVCIKFSEPMGGDRCEIILYSAESEKMPDITTTTRL